MFSNSQARVGPAKTSEVPESEELLKAYKERAEGRAEGKTTAGNKVIVLKMKDNGEFEVKAQERTWSLFFGFENAKMSFSNLVEYTTEIINKTFKSETKIELTKHLIKTTRDFESKPLTIWTRIFSYGEKGKEAILTATFEKLTKLGYDYKSVESAKKDFIAFLADKNIKAPKSFADCAKLKVLGGDAYNRFIKSLEAALPRKNFLDGSTEKGFDSEYLQRLDKEYGF